MVEMPSTANVDQHEDGHDLERAPSQHLGPSYVPSDDKPSATVSTKVDQDNVHILSQTPQLIALLTYVRNAYTRVCKIGH